MVVFLSNTVICVFLLLCLCILNVYLCTFIVPAGTLRLPWLSFFCVFSSVVRQIPGYNSQRLGTACTLPKICVLFCVLFVLCRSVYCLCVNVFSTTATGWQPNCSLTCVSCHISKWQSKEVTIFLKHAHWRIRRLNKLSASENPNFVSINARSYWWKISWAAWKK